MAKDYTLQNAMKEFDFQIDKLLTMKENDAEYEETISKIKDLQNTIGEELEKLFGKDRVYTNAQYGTTAADRAQIEKNSEK
jgi:hypothetical protein